MSPGRRPTVVVGRGTAGGDVDEAERRVGGDSAPCVGCTCSGLLVESPRDRIPTPEELAGADVEAAYGTDLCIHSNVIRDGRANHYYISKNRWSGGDGVGSICSIVDADFQIDEAVVSEVATGLAGIGVQRDESGGQSPEEEPGSTFAGTGVGVRSSQSATPREVMRLPSLSLLKGI